MVWRLEQWFVVMMVSISFIQSLLLPTIHLKSQSTSLLRMSGKSRDEVGLSKKVIFRKLKQRLEQAAAVPGFLDEPDRPEIDLYCSSTIDGAQIDSCPFSQFVQLVLLRKGVRYVLSPVLPTTMPDIVRNNHGGELPCLVHNNVSIVGPLAIAEYLEKSFPHKPLTRQGVLSYRDVLDRTLGFWPAVTAAVVNKDPALDASLLQAVDSHLDVMDEVVRSTPGHYLCGVEMTLVDLYLLPQLYHAMVALPRFKAHDVVQLEAAPIRPALENFINRMLRIEEFKDKRAHYNVDKIVHGWKVARGEFKRVILGDESTVAT